MTSGDMPGARMRPSSPPPARQSKHAVRPFAAWTVLSDHANLVIPLFFGERASAEADDPTRLTAERALKILRMPLARFLIIALIAASMVLLAGGLSEEQWVQPR